MLEDISQTKYEFYMFIQTLQIVSSMCSLLRCYVKLKLNNYISSQISVLKFDIDIKKSFLKKNIYFSKEAFISFSITSFKFSKQIPEESGWIYKIESFKIHFFAKYCIWFALTFQLKNVRIYE